VASKTVRQQTKSTVVSDDARAANRPRAIYAAALQRFVRTAAQGCDERALHTLFSLNAAYYLHDYLSAKEHARLVRRAAASVVEVADYRGLPSTTAVATTANLEPALSVERLLRQVETTAYDSHALTAAQHTLEVLPLLGGVDGAALLHTAEGYVSAAAGAGRMTARVWPGGQSQLHCWATWNSRPPRDGETVAWTRQLLDSTPQHLLEQGLASGLRFNALLDALAGAAALYAIADPGEDAWHTLMAAHAARRLTELGGRPAIGAWLGVATSLRDKPVASSPSPPGTSPSERALALLAARSTDPHALQLAEAALVEAAAVAPELRPTVLAALTVALSVSPDIPANTPKTPNTYLVLEGEPR